MTDLFEKEIRDLSFTGEIFNQPFFSANSANLKNFPLKTLKGHSLFFVHKE